MSLLYNKITSRAVIDAQLPNGFYKSGGSEYSAGFDGLLVRDMPVLRKRNFHRGAIVILLSALILGKINWKRPATS